MSGLSIFSVKVGPMTVFVPPGPLVGHCTVGDSDVIVLVLGRERSALVVAQRVTWGKKETIITTNMLKYTKPLRRDHLWLVLNV